MQLLIMGHRARAMQVAMRRSLMSASSCGALELRNRDGARFYTLAVERFCPEASLRAWNLIYGETLARRRRPIHVDYIASRRSLHVRRHAAREDEGERHV